MLVSSKNLIKVYGDKVAVNGLNKLSQAVSHPNEQELYNHSDVD